MYRRRIVFLLIITMMIIPVSTIYSQENEPNNQNQSAAQYILPGEKNVIQMQINIWGEVKKPGIYRVPSDIDLVRLLSSAGGPNDFAKLDGIKIVRAFPQEGKPRVIEVDIEQYLETANPDGLPKLYPGDTVYVPGNFRRYFSTSLGIASSIASITSAVALIYERIARANSY